jgi:divalent metal cation (Fe/Co/Zn/Cd) transporter
VPAASPLRAAALLRRGLRLEQVTLAWNGIGVVVTAVAAVRAGSIAIGGFGLDSVVEIGASTVVISELTDTSGTRRGRALRLIGWGFSAIAAYIAVQSIWLLAAGVHPGHSPLGIAWAASTLAGMLALAWGKLRTGAGLGNPVLQAEGRVTLVDAYLAAAVLVGLLLNALLGWWWADPAAGLVIVFYGVREARAALTEAREHD